MLQKLREKTTGWIAGTILVLMTIPFAFFGMEQYLFQRNDTSAAKIQAPPSWWTDAPSWWPASMLWQHQVIEADEFRTAFEQARQRQRDAMGDNFDSRAFQSADNKRKVLDELIDQKVLDMLADNKHIAVSDARVIEEIESIQAFQVGGKFSAQQYQLALAAQVPPRTPMQFQQQVREDLQSTLVPRALVQSGFTTDSELDRLVTLLGERRDITIATIPAPEPDTAAVDAKAIQAWYDSHGSDFMAPETVSFEYVDIDGGTLPAPPAADEAALRQRYEREKARFVEPERRLASHILVKVDADADAAAQKAARDEAAKIAAQAKSPGADFAALARANSDDSGSKGNGGDLGWVTRDMMVTPFEDALFAMQPGEIRGPVKSEFGWHIIQLREIDSGRQTPFEDVRDQLAQEQADADRERAFNELTGKLVDQVYKNPNSLSAAARAAGLPVLKAGPVARGQGSGVIANQAVQRALFSEALIQDGTVSDPIEVGPNHSVLVRVTGHQPERQRPLSEVASQVIAAIRHDRAATAAARRADALLAQVRAGKSLQEVAQAAQLVVGSLPGIPRGAPVPDAVTAKAIFAAPRPAEGKVTAGKVVLGDGSIVVFAIDKITPGDPGDVTAEQRETMRAQLAQIAGNEDARALVEAARERMEISINEANL